MTDWYGTLQLHGSPGWPPSGRNKIPTFHWLFPDQIQFFTNQNTAVLRPICLLAADKWQIPFTSSLKCTSLILQMKQIKPLNSFLAQNVLKLTSFHTKLWASEARERKKNHHFFNISSSQNTWYNMYFGPKLWNSLTFLVFKISLTNLQNSLTFLWPWRKIKFPWLFPDQWPPWILSSRLPPVADLPLA